MNKPFIRKGVCPNCGKEGVEVMVYPSHQGHSTSRISAKSVTKSYSVPEKTVLMSGCSDCGLSLTALKFIEKEGKFDHEKRIRRMQDAGIPTRIEG